MWGHKKSKGSSQPNVKFYLGQIGINEDSRGAKIDEFIQKFLGDYAKLEMDHAWVQWLFPNHYESRFNWSSIALGYDEAEIFRNNEEIAIRFVRAYQLFLDFLGIRLVDLETGELARSTDYKERFANVIFHGHNFLRMRRLAASLSVCGFFKYAVQFIGFMRYEAYAKATKSWIPNQVHRKAPNAKRNTNSEDETPSTKSRYQYRRPKALGNDPYRGEVGSWDSDFWDIYYPGTYTRDVAKELRLKTEDGLAESIFFTLSNERKESARIPFADIPESSTSSAPRTEVAKKVESSHKQEEGKRDDDQTQGKKLGRNGTELMEDDEDPGVGVGDSSEGGAAKFPVEEKPATTILCNDDKDTHDDPMEEDSKTPNKND